MSGTMIGKGIPGRKGWSAWPLSTLMVVVSLLGTGLPQATAQTLGLAPNPYVYDDCGQIRGICCPGPLVWGFDPYGGCDHCPNCNGDCRLGFTAHRPLGWYASVGAAVLTPDRYEEINLARLGPTGVVALSTADVKSEWDAGGRFTIGRTINACWQAEISYQGNYGWSDTQTATSAAGDLSSILSGFANPVNPLFDQNNVATVTLASRMATAEANIRTWLEMPPGPLDLQVFVGARYFASSDHLQYITTGVNTNDITVNTGNDMYGVQLGTSAHFLLHRLFYLDFEGKIALCENFVEQNTSFVQNGGAALTTANAVSRTALLGELSLCGTFQFRPNVAIRAGYQAIFVNGLALAPQNIPTDTFALTNGVGQFRDDGEMVYHGPTLGLVGTW